MYIATKFNDDARAKLIIRWEELETQHRVPKSFSEALMLAARQAEELEQKDRQLQEQKPKVLFAEAVEASHTSIRTGELAITDPSLSVTDEPRQAICLNCGEFFKPQRSSVRYFSDKCRVQYNNQMLR